MKNEKLIRTNLIQKVAIFSAQQLVEKDRIKIVEHIKMLDWVLSDSQSTRDIHVIMNEYLSKKCED